MALFGSNKDETPTVKRIRPTVLRTENVAKELMRIAKSNDVHVGTLDFTLLEVQTLTRKNDGKSETDFEEITLEDLHDIDENSFLDEKFEIKQIYEVEVYSKEESDPYKNFHLAVGANATKCKIYLSIKAGSVVDYNPSFDKDLLKMITKAKIRAGILVYVFDEMMDSVISKISAHVRIEEHAEYTENTTILIAEGFEPTPTIDDNLLLHFEKKEEVGENDKVDHAARGFIHNVYKDELLIEYVKPQKGKPGRDCRGHFLAPKEPVVSHEPQFNVDDSINVVDTPERIEYRSKENGYISFEDNKYTIKTDVDVGEISFRTTGSIASGLDSDVSISVKETDSFKDAIGTGMHVEVSEINIEGNVGPKAVVSANKATIGGQTHKSSEVSAEELNINVHKGKAKGSNIKVTRLEHGIINGEIVNVAQAIGGVINAKEITIGICSSYVKATASRRIVIEKLQGSENVFTIDPLLQDAADEFHENEEQVIKLKADLKALDKELEQYTQLVHKNTNAFNDVKKRLIHYKKNGVKMPESFVKQYRQFQKMSEHLTSLQADSKAKKDQLTLLTTRTASFQDNIFDARIINKDHWVGHNQLKVKLVDPPVEVSFNPPEGCPDKTFALVELDEGGYVIKAVKE